MIDPATILLEADPQGSVPIIPVSKGNHETSLPDRCQRWLAATGFTAEAGQHALVPGEEGLRDIRVVEAIYRAAASGKQVRLM